MEPITLAAVLTAAWQGFVGNRTDDWLGRGGNVIRSLLKNIRQSGELPPNHDLYLLLESSMLAATDYLINHVIPLSGNPAIREAPVFITACRIR